MVKWIKKTSLSASAAFVAGMLIGTQEANAQSVNNNFSSIAENIIGSITHLPALLSGVAYMFGILLGVLGILKIKDHVENPQQTALKDGAIRLAAGGGLFALPIIYEAMKNTLDPGQSAGPATATLAPVTFHK